MEILLPILLLIPLAGAALCFAVPARSARWVALWTSLVELALTLPIAGVAFGRDALAWAPDWLVIEGLDTGLRLGCGAVSWWLIFLTAFLQPLAVLGSFAGIKERENSYYFWLTALVTAMVGTFLARDGLLFYVFFELTLVPMFFLIGIWGGEERNYAARKFFLFTFVGGVFTLAGVLYLGITGGSFSFGAMTAAGQAIADPRLKVLVFFALFAGFAVKTPLFPVHTWLPLAHTVAPTAGSVILAGVLLKLGTYGIMMLAIPMGLLSNVALPGVDGDGLLPVMRDSVIPFVAVLCIVGIIYGALVAWVQQDVKKLVAYSSVSHLGFCVLGLIALNTTGQQGGVFYMISHGISTGALFLLVGMIYDRYHTRLFRDYGGLGRVMPVYSFFMVLFTMSSIGLPGTNGFVSEFLSILGAFTSPYLGPWFGAFAAIGVILGAVYMLYMVARLIFGPLKIPESHAASAHAFDATAGGAGNAHAHAPGDLPRDLNGREIGLLVPLALAVIVLGVVPNTVLQSILPDVEAARNPAIVSPTRDTPAGRNTGGANPAGGPGGSPSSIGLEN
jgi:NADH-quinone oxidoreductase subunit M